MVAIAMSSVIEHEPLSGGFWMASAAFRISIGLTVCLCGASALFGYDRWRKVAALGITLASLAAMVLFLHEIITLGPLLQLAYFLTPLVGLALLAAASLPQMAACAILVGGGAISLAITYQGFVSSPVVVVDTFQDTYFIVAHNQHLISVFGIFTLLGALTVWTQPRLPVWVISLLASLILLGQVASYAPMVFLGRMGMPRRYVDYDDSIALWNQISTFGAMVLILALTILLVLIWLRRTR